MDKKKALKRVIRGLSAGVVISSIIGFILIFIKTGGDLAEVKDNTFLHSTATLGACITFVIVVMAILFTLIWAWEKDK